jgi:hypothetical protein
MAKMKAAKTRLLAFDPTPAGLVTKPLRKEFKGLWARIRQEHFDQGNLNCETCQTAEAEAKLIHAHEVYVLDDPEMVRLQRVAFICTRCHDVMHYDRTRRRCQPPYLQTLKDHYCKVNGGLSEAEFENDLRASLLKSNEIRKAYGGAAATPPIDYGPYEDRANASSLRKQAWADAHDDDDDTEYEDYIDDDWLYFRDLNSK